MKKIFGISLVILLIIAVGIFGFIEQSRDVQTKELPKDVPIIAGKIVSAKATRSDELKRGIEIVVKSNLSLPEAAKYYNDEFVKRNFIMGNLPPEFQGNAKEIENSTEATAIAWSRSHQQIVVFIRSEAQSTLVTIQVLGNSFLFLPS